MFNPGDYVIYGDSGFFRVEQVAVPDFDTFEKGKLYYFLRSEVDGTRIYTSVDTHQPLRAPVTQPRPKRCYHSFPQCNHARPTPMTAKPCCFITGS